MSERTKDWALDALCARMQARWPAIDISKEREVLSRRSRASLLHSVGAALYGDIDRDYDPVLCEYAYSQMTAAEQRELRQ